MRRLFAVFVVVSLGVAGAAGLLVPAVEAGGGGHGQCLPQEGAGQTVVIQDTCFSPSVLYVEAGAAVAWQQRDGIPHDVTSLKGEMVGNRGLQNGESVSRSFDSPGVFAYYCTIHPGMWGVVVVGDPASPEFGASLSVETASASRGDPPEWAKGSGPSPSAGWSEAAVGLGLFGGLLVGLVVVGGGIVRRRGR